MELQQIKLRNTLRNIRDLIKRNSFRFAEKRLGIHVTPVHFYSPIPNVGELKPELFSRPNECVGLDFREQEQLARLQADFRKYLGEYAPKANSGLAQVDAFVLYALIREKRPKEFIEIGSGESTKITLAALAKNEAEGYQCAMTAIEPFPKPFLREIRQKNFDLVVKRVQDVDVNRFSQADILFIDSSHVSKIGSDVNYEILDIVPRLKVGALVHWHDIMIPGDYSKEWIESGTKFWNESYMVHAFMLNNKCFEVVWASRFMQLNYSADLSGVFSYFNPSDPAQQLSSFWIKRVS